MKVFSVLASAGTTHVKLLSGLLAIAGVSVLTFWWTSDRAYSPEVVAERNNLVKLVPALEGAYKAKGFASLSVSAAVGDKLVPASMLRSQGSLIQSSWGTDVDLRPHSVRTPADGFSVIYQKVPGRECQSFAMAMGAQVYDLKINGQSIMGVDAPEPSLVQAQCAGDQGAPMEFVFHSDLIPGTAVLR